MHWNTTVEYIYSLIYLSQSWNGCKIGFQETYIKYFFHLFEPFRPRWTLKLAKSAKKANIIFPKIWYVHHKTQNSMLSSNPLKKVPKFYPKKVRGGAATKRWTLKRIYTIT